MKTKPSKILAMMLVLGLLAGIPASTQVLSGSEGADEVGLGMLVLINRLELSVEQMQALHGILMNLHTSTDTLTASSDTFRDAMIAFTGTSEELDALMEAYRQEQQSAMADVRGVAATSLREIGDLLTLNQGLALRAALSELQGRREIARPFGAVVGDGRSDVSSAQAAGRAMAERMPWMSRMMEDDETAVNEDGLSLPATRLQKLRDRLPEAMREGLAARAETALESLREPRAMNADEVGLPTATIQGFLGRSVEHGRLMVWLEQAIEALELKLAAVE
jgi:hypothetical protein